MGLGLGFEHHLLYSFHQYIALIWFVVVVILHHSITWHGGGWARSLDSGGDQIITASPARYH